MKRGATIAERLTPKECQIVSLVLDGFVTTEALAERMGHVPQVTKNYLRNIYDVTGTDNRAELILWAVHHPQQLYEIEYRAKQAKYFSPIPGPLDDDGEPHQPPRLAIHTLAAARYVELRETGMKLAEHVDFCHDFEKFANNLEHPHRKILMLTGAGLTQSQIAGELGMCLRTVSRLCAHYGIAPNDQAGEKRGRKPKHREG